MSPDLSPISIDLAREPDFSLGVLKVRPSLRQVEWAGGSETLEPRVMQVLVALAQKRGEVVSRDELIQRCWDGRAVGEDALTRCISRLRKLGETGQAFSIETIPRVGYRLMAAAGAPAAAMAGEPAAAPPGRRFNINVRAWRIGILAAAAAFVALAFLGFWLLKPGAPAGGAMRIAVLPFDVVSGGQEAIVLSRTAASTIADQLLEAGHEVVPPSLTQAYTGEKRRDVARELRATHIVDGEVSEKDGRLILTTRIMDRNGASIGVYPLEAKDGTTDLARQSAASVTYAFRWLMAAPGGNEADVLRSAEDLSNQSLLAAYEERRRFLEKATAPDPMAQISLLMTAANALPEALPADRPRMLAEMREARRRAEELGIGPSMLGLADVALIPEVDWAARDAALRNSIDKPPLMGLNAGTYSAFLLQAGRAVEAETYARKDVSMEPTSPFGGNYLASALMVLGRNDEAVALMQDLIQRFPNNGAIQQGRFASLIWTGDLDGAEAMLADPKVADAIDPPAPVRPVKLTLKAWRTRSPADVAAFAAACRDPTRLSQTGGGICVTGNTELGRLAHPNAITTQARLLMSPVTAPLRRDPRIIDVFERIGLIDFWRTTGKWPDFCVSEPQSVCARMKAL
jgi:DNA-binding winged helix-turn-helix (wHTH) protein/TolB-like protein